MTDSQLFKTLFRSKRLIDVLKNAITGGLSQATSVLVGLLIIPLSIRHLGAEKYGIWMAVNSFIAILGVSNFGIGNALLKLTAEQYRDDQHYNIFGLLSSALKIMTTIALVLFLAIISLSFLPFIKEIISVKQGGFSSEILATVRVLSALFVINLVAQISTPIRLGMQAGYINGLYQTAGHLINLFAVVFVINFNTSLPFLTAAAISGTTVANLINLILLIKKSYAINNINNINNLPQTNFFQIIRRSAPFLFLSFIGLMSYNIDNLVIISRLSPANVTENAIAQRVFSIPISIVSLFYIGLWAAYADASVKGDFHWVRKTFVNTAFSAVLFTTLVSSVILIFSKQISFVLSGSEVSFAPELVVAFWLWAPITCLSGATASLMNGLHLMRIQVIIALAALAINLPLSLFLVARIGVSGPIWGTLISMALTQPLMLAWSLFELKRKTTKTMLEI